MTRLHTTALLLAAAFLSACGGAVQSRPANDSSKTGSSRSGGGISAVPANAVTISDIQKMPNWSSCSSNCAGQSGTNAIYSLQQGIPSPSLSGSAIQFSITGGTPWAAALWWKQLGGDDTATHFVYDLSYYLADPSAAQALEFNVNQNVGGWRYEYATQCDIRGSGMWRVWDHANMQWVTTTAPCKTPAANTWNNLQWELQRTTDNKVVWVAVTLNGQRSVINQSFDAFPAAGSGIDVAFQMDSDGVPTPWSVWVDDISLTKW